RAAGRARRLFGATIDAARATLLPLDDMTHVRRRAHHLGRPRVLFACGREASYVRNRLLLRALAARFPVSIVASDRPTYPSRFAGLVPRLLIAARQSDLIVAGFLGQPLALIARALRKPILLDAFVSVYDTICLDRQIARPTSPVGRLAYGLDRLAVL